MIKVPTHQGEKIVSLYSQNNKATKYMRQNPGAQEAEAA